MMQIKKNKKTENSFKICDYCLVQEKHWHMESQWFSSYKRCNLKWRRVN